MNKNHRDQLLNAIKAFDFNEIYLVPGYTEVEPSEVDLSTYFTRHIMLHIPLAAAPMDTVTGYEMAVALALYGAIGVIHRNCSIEEQVEMVKRVKRHPPINLRNVYAYEQEPCLRVLSLMKEESIRQIPVISSNGKVLGYVTYSDLLELCRENNYVPVIKLLRNIPVYSLDDIAEAIKAIERGELDSIAITTREGFYLGTLTIKEVFEEYNPIVDEDGKLIVAAAISPFDVDRALKLDKFVNVLVSDVAHFHNKNVIDASKKLVKRISSDFVAGNIGTYEAAIDVITKIEKVDGLRVGIGGGTICTTPDVTGVYAPTLWAVASVRDAIDEMGVKVPIIADGGIRTPGDAVKALALGASCVMGGYIFAGTDEAIAPLITVNGKLYKPYRGMASPSAMKKRFTIDRYSRTVKKVPEGIEGLVPYRGPVSKVLKEYVEAIKAGLGYVGARNIKELWMKAKFIVTVKHKHLQKLDPLSK